MLTYILKIKPVQIGMAVLSILLVVSMLASCGSGGEKAPDVSGVKIELNTRRLDKDLYSIDTNNIGTGLQSLSGKYPDFLNFYLDTLLGFGINRNYNDTNSAIRFGLKSFLTHKDYRGLYDTVIKHFPDTKEIDGKLKSGFQYVTHYYPEYKTPNIIYLVSGLNNWGAFTYDDDVMGIGLDMFLGASYPYYKSVGIPDYMSEKLTPGHIPVAAMRAVYQGMMPFVPEDRNLLDMMIQKGKEAYFLQKVLPSVSEHERLGYTKAQLDWCTNNEAHVYNFFVKENLLYDKDWQKILRFVNDGPTSAGMPAESPGNIGSWVGLQIVKAYVAQSPEMSLKELTLQLVDAQAFLQKSKYKPR